MFLFLICFVFSVIDSVEDMNYKKREFVCIY